MAKLQKIIKFIFSRKLAIIILLAAQVALLAAVFIKLQEYSTYIYILFAVLSVIVVVYIMNKSDNPSYKLAWVIPVLLFPIFGGIVYLFLNAQLGTAVFKHRIKVCAERTKPYMEQDKKVLEEIREDNPYTANLVEYMNNFAGFPAYKNTTVEYFRCGEEKFEALKHELRQAEHFIFMEYFIIEEGNMWDEILEILAEKAKNGVDVRLLYDGMGSLMVLPDKYNKKLNSMGIKCKVFNAFRPFLSSTQNNRDHRKITVIDGHTAFNGGINLADEYINKKVLHGYWKDTAVMLKGDAVWNFTMMFLQMWSADGKSAADDFENFRPHTYHPEPFEGNGYVLPYGDSPLDDETVGENVYTDIINKAKDYVYITTPYLILDHEMTETLSFAAKSGVDVRIIIPGIPDKWYAYAVAQSFCKELTARGVKIYRYTPGFVHAKSFVSDDTAAVVGSINLDYRSLYLHFECATFMYKNTCVSAVKEDFEDMLKQCDLITLEELKKTPLAKRVLNSILGLFAPLL